MMWICEKEEKEEIGLNVRNEEIIWICGLEFIIIRDMDRFVRMHDDLCYSYY